MKRRKAIAAVLAAVLSLVSASAAYAKELSEQEMTKQEAAEVLEQEPTEQETAEPPQEDAAEQLSMLRFARCKVWHAESSSVLSLGG